MIVAALALTVAGQSCVGVEDVTAFESIEPLVKKAQESRVVVLGEQHRTRQAPLLLKDLVDALGPRGFDVLAIEGQEDRQVFVEQYLAGTADESVLAQTFLTPDVRDVIVRIKQTNDAAHERKERRDPWRVLLVDGPSAWNVSTLEQSRDQRMFGRVRRVLDEDPGARVLVYVGNTHTSEGVRLRDAAEGPGHKLDAIPIEIDPLGKLLDLYTSGKSLSVRTIGPEDPLGSMWKRRSPNSTRATILVDGSAIAQSTGCVEPGGSFNEALRTAPLGVFTDVVVIFPDLGVARSK